MIIHNFLSDFYPQYLTDRVKKPKTIRVRTFSLPFFMLINNGEGRTISAFLHQGCYLRLRSPLKLEENLVLPTGTLITLDEFERRFPNAFIHPSPNIPR